MQDAWLFGLNVLQCVHRWSVCFTMGPSPSGLVSGGVVTGLAGVVCPRCCIVSRSKWEVLVYSYYGSPLADWIPCPPVVSFLPVDVFSGRPVFNFGPTLPADCLSRILDLSAEGCAACVVYDEIVIVGFRSRKGIFCQSSTVSPIQVM